MPSIDINTVAFSFGSRPVFSDVSLKMSGPGVGTLLGLSGSGKTTLLRIIAGILSASSGTVRVASEDKLRLAWVPQNLGLFPWLTIEQNISFPLILDNADPKMSDAAAVTKARVIATELGIENVCQMFPINVSGGQMQRAAIGRAIAARANILLMDEPFSALDAKTRMETRKLIRKISFYHKMITIIATHDLYDAAYSADKIWYLSSCIPSKISEFKIGRLPTDEERSKYDVLDIVRDLELLFISKE